MKEQITQLEALIMANQNVKDVPAKKNEDGSVTPAQVLRTPYLDAALGGLITARDNIKVHLERTAPTAPVTETPAAAQ